MGIVERVKELFEQKETVTWECADCGEIFRTEVPADTAVSEMDVACEECSSADVEEIARSF